MTQAKPKSEGIPLVEVRDKDIPQWVEDLPRPPGPPLATLLTYARYEYGWIGHHAWSAFFRKLVETMFARIGEPPYLGDRAKDFLTVLDLAPVLITHGRDALPADVHDRLVEGLADLFKYRAYLEVDVHRKRLGKPPSGDDLGVHRVYTHARLNGLKDKEAIEFTRKAYPDLSPEGVRSANRRARRGPFPVHVGPYNKIEWEVPAQEDETGEPQPDESDGGSDGS